MQKFRDGVVLRMCCGLTFTLFVGFFDKYYVATIPINLDLNFNSFLIFLFPEFLEGIPCIVILHRVVVVVMRHLNIVCYEGHFYSFFTCVTVYIWSLFVT